MMSLIVLLEYLDRQPSISSSKVASARQRQRQAPPRRVIASPQCPIQIKPQRELSGERDVPCLSRWLPPFLSAHHVISQINPYVRQMHLEATQQRYLILARDAEMPPMAGHFECEVGFSRFRNQLGFLPFQRLRILLLLPRSLSRCPPGLEMAPDFPASLECRVLCFLSAATAAIFVSLTTTW